VFNVSNVIKGNTSMHTKIQQQYSFITLISGPYKDWEQSTFAFAEKFSALLGGKLRHSSGGKLSELWSPNATSIIKIMTNDTHFDCKNISGSILSHLWTYQIDNDIVLFLKSNEHAGNDLQQNTSESAQGTFLELHNFYLYYNSDRCNSADSAVPVNVFTVRNVTDIKTKYLKVIMIRIFTNIQFMFVYIQRPFCKSA
jgi:hypothetical protein